MLGTDLLEALDETDSNQEVEPALNLNQNVKPFIPGQNSTNFGQFTNESQYTPADQNMNVQSFDNVNMCAKAQPWVPKQQQQEQQ